MDFLVASTAVTEVYHNVTPVLHECELHWCVRTIRSEYYSGNYTETILKEEQLETNTTDPWPHTNYYTANFSLETAKSVEQHDPPFQISNLTARCVMFSVEVGNPSCLTVQNISSVPLLKWEWQSNPPFVEPSVDNPWMSPDNVATHVELIARAMSNVIRNGGDSNETQTQGTGVAWDEKQLIGVNCVWTSLPFAMLLVSFFFITSTVIRSSKERNKVGIWKHSALPVVFNGLNTNDKSLLHSQHNLTEVRRKAKVLSVILFPK
jgi:hypothetical protein